MRYPVSLRCRSRDGTNDLSSRHNGQQAGQPTVNPVNQRLLQQFSDCILLERGLSRNTLSAYTSDLKRFATWLEAREHSLLTATRTEIMEYLSSRLKDGASSRSSAISRCSMASETNSAMSTGPLPEVRPHHRRPRTRTRPGRWWARHRLLCVRLSRRPGGPRRCSRRLSGLPQDRGRHAR